MNEAYIAAKERWARRQSGAARPEPRPTSERIPPGQRQVHNFPVLDLGVKPAIPHETWELRIGGEVENPVVLRDRKSTRLNSSHVSESRMPSSA